MKILLTSPTYPPFNSGLGNAVQYQAKTYVAAGHDVTVATWGLCKSDYVDKTSGAIVKEFDISGSSLVFRPIKGEFERYRNFLVNSHYDIIIFNAWHTWSTDIPLQYLNKIYGKKYVYSHGISINWLTARQPILSLVKFILSRPYWWKLKKSICFLEGIIFLAKGGCDTRFDDYIYAKKNDVPIKVIPNASSLKPDVIELKFSDWRSRAGVLAVGSYEWQKGHDYAMRAYAYSPLKNQVPLIIFGQKFNAYSDYLKKLAAGLDIDPGYISFHEDVSGKDLMKAYLSARVMIFGSHTECQPLVLIDAMSAGLPFVARRSGAIPSMLGGVAVGSQKEASKFLTEIYNNELIWLKYHSCGIKMINDIHDPQVVSEKLIKLL